MDSQSDPNSDNSSPIEQTESPTKKLRVVADSISGGLGHIKKYLKISRGTVGSLVLALFTFLLGILGALFTTWLTSKDPHLTKRIFQVIPFKGEKGETGILNFTLSSDGTKEVENIEGYAKVEGSTIEDVRITPAIIRATKIINGDTVAITVASLNATEDMQVSALVKKVAGLPTVPVVEFRGKGVNAEEKPAQLSNGSPGWVFFLSGFAVIFGAMSYSGIQDLFNRNKEQNKTDIIQLVYEKSLKSLEENVELQIADLNSSFDSRLETIKREYDAEIERAQSITEQATQLMDDAKDQAEEAKEAHKETMKIRESLLTQIDLNLKIIENQNKTMVVLHDLGTV